MQIVVKTLTGKTVSLNIEIAIPRTSETIRHSDDDETNKISFNNLQPVAKESGER